MYGNIATLSNLSIKIRAYEVIPYLIIGMMVSFSIGVASVSSILYKKFEGKRKSAQKGLVDKSKQVIRKISFIDDAEEDIKENL